MADKTGSSNRSSSRAHNRSSWPNESKVCITVINSTMKKNKSFRPQHTQTNLAKCPPINATSTETWNCSVAIQTGSTYICDSMTDIITIPTVNLLSEWVWRKYQQVTVTSLTTGNSDMADKTGNSYKPLELQLIAPKFQRQVRYFWPRRVRIKCPQMTTTMSDNRKWYYGRKNRKYLYLLNHER